MPQKKTLRFASTDRDFSITVNQRVNEYFKVNNINRNANAEMIIKTVCMFAGYFVPYGIILSGAATSTPVLLGLVIVMGFGLAGIGLSVMHDANHGSYSGKNWVNNVIGYSLNLIGSSAFNWKLQHNVLHHTFTNVHEEDEDIRPRGALRLTPHTTWKKIHRYQFIYAWFLYGMMTITWMIANDFTRLVRYHKSGLVKKQKADIGKEWAILIATKIFYVGYILVAPLVFTSLPWWEVLIGILIMHYIAGFILAIIFQPAHVNETTEFPLPDESYSMETNWAVHQLRTTTNFGNRSRWFSWYVGALNFQIEHHLFPNVCHVHYRKISGIVQETAQEFGLPYKSARTFIGALSGHGRLLKELGKRPVMVKA